ncbi:MAG: phosphoenolpyruvate carboxylase [Dehalococcoidia bacterium]|nr:phosphoenolpyruvate carboxylase [Dehalococcoidia bacterium]
MVNIPRCMSTQHPDNVQIPFFAEDPEMSGEDEIKEAYYAFANLGCDEQMWDSEGKEVDSYVVKKLLTRYEAYFRKNRLGENRFLTIRVPNPAVERGEGKILLETLDSIPRSYDAAKLFYGDDERDVPPPIFEVILPMASTAASLRRIDRYYADFVAGKQDQPLSEGDITVAEWIGEFKPDRINVIPLFEDMQHMLNAHLITEEYLRGTGVRAHRIFLARSDPAMNYGMISAVLLNKIALHRLWTLSQDKGIELYPILGVGSAPFRGNLTPATVNRTIREFPSVHTFTLQSAFKYDHHPDEVRDAVETIQRSPKSPPQGVDEEYCLDVIDRCSQEYQRQVVALAPLINEIARFIPSRRKRKLHIGLFGYSRDVGRARLPRAISFTAALYSIGLPPEILGLSALRKNDMDFLKGVYLNLEDDLRDALQYLNPNVVSLLPKNLSGILDTPITDFHVNDEHKDITTEIISKLLEDDRDGLGEQVVKAASVRKFLG